MRRTKKDLDEFAEHCRYYLGLMCLTNIETEFVLTNDPDCEAAVEVYPSSTKFMLSRLPGPSPRSLKYLALHECTHRLMADVVRIGCNRWARGEEMETAAEALTVNITEMFWNLDL